MGFKQFQNNTTLTAEDINDYLMEQTAMVFTGSTDRNNQLPSPQEGQLTYLTLYNRWEYWNGSSWVELVQVGRSGLPTAQAAGTVLAGPSNSGAFTTTVTFPSGRFTAAPQVFINLNSGSGSHASWFGRAISISNTGFTLFGFNTTGTAGTWSAEWQWHAVQM